MTEMNNEMASAMAAGMGMGDLLALLGMGGAPRQSPIESDPAKREAHAFKIGDVVVIKDDLQAVEDSTEVNPRFMLLPDQMKYQGATMVVVELMKDGGVGMFDAYDCIWDAKFIEKTIGNIDVENITEDIIKEFGIYQVPDVTDYDDFFIAHQKGDEGAILSNGGMFRPSRIIYGKTREELENFIKTDVMSDDTPEDGEVVVNVREFKIALGPDAKYINAEEFIYCGDVPKNSRRI